MPVENNAGLADAFCIGCGYALRRPDIRSLPRVRPKVRSRRSGDHEPRPPAAPLATPTAPAHKLGAGLSRHARQRNADLPQPMDGGHLSRIPVGTGAGASLDRLAAESAVCAAIGIPVCMSALGTVPAVLASRATSAANDSSSDSAAEQTARENNPPGARAIAIAAALSLICVFFGWHERIARRWIADQSGSSPPVWWGRYGTIRPPFALTPDQCSDVLYRPLTDQPTPTERLEVLRLLLEYGGKTALPALCHAERVEEDTVVLQWELRDRFVS